MNKPYYEAYESRYRAVQAVSPELFWGNSPDDPELNALLADWVGRFALREKSVVEFCCGEGGSARILAALGCKYQGYDLSPSAITKAANVLKGLPDASVATRDLVQEPLPAASFDAALDVMGLHMLVVDADRRAYLLNMLNALRPGAPALFLYQLYRPDACSQPVDSLADWERINGVDYSRPEARRIGGGEQTVLLPRIPGRARNQAEYVAELESVGFVVDEFSEMPETQKVPSACLLHVHKP